MCGKTWYEKYYKNETAYQRKSGGLFLQFLIIFRWNIYSNVFDSTVKDTAEVVESSCIHRFIFAQFINDCTGNMMVFD